MGAWGEGVKAYMVTKTLLKEKKNQHGPVTHRNGIQNLDVNWKQSPNLKKI